MSVESEQPSAAAVLDTSLFSNPATAAPFGGNTAAAVATFVALARLVQREMVFYMPPSVLDELQTFLDSGELPGEFELVVNLRGPRRHEVQIPGSLLYELIDDMRQRIDRGLRIAEEAVRTGVTKPPRVTIGPMREKYRDALRSGFIDSGADVDILLLAAELGAAVISADRGVVTWAEKLGLRIIHPERLHGILTALISHRS